jgi:hypothetical protein
VVLFYPIKPHIWHKKHSKSICTISSHFFIAYSHLKVILLLFKSLAIGVTMKENNHKFNWILDFLILAGFLISFFIDLTGLEVHQWLGVAVFILIVLHLINHWGWVEAVLSRFFGKTSPRARLYAAIDLLLLFGFVMIVETGLVISTWLNLTLNDFNTWANLHTYFSIGSLILVLIKIGLHWRWIVTVAGKLFRGPSRPATPSPLGNTQALNRRQFLVTMGVVSLGSALAISNVLSKRKASDASLLANNVDLTSTQSAIKIAAEMQPAATQEQVQATQPPAIATSVPQATATATVQPTAQPVVSCSYGCRKGRHCSYPGQCREYQDSNSNGLCDLGECS